MLQPNLSVNYLDIETLQYDKIKVVRVHMSGR